MDEYTKGDTVILREPGGHFSISSDKSITVWRNPNAETQAKLIAAAPDLLAACKELEEHARKYGGVPKSATKLWDRVRNAIAKAEPETG